MQTAFLGDVVLTRPLLRALRQDPRVAFAAIAVDPRGAEAVEGMVDDAIVIDKRGTHRSWKGMSAAANMLRDVNFTAALVPHRSFRSALLVARAGIPVRIGFAGAEGAMLYTHRVARRAALHEAERILDLGRAIGLDGSAVARRRTPPAGGQPTIVVAPGSRWATKRWTTEGFAEVARSLARRGWRVVVTGSESDAHVCRAVTALGEHPAIENACGLLSLTELTDLIRDAAAVVSNDSATVHIADEEGTPSVVVFGPTVPELGFAPRVPGSVAMESSGLVCRPCGDHGGDRCPVGTHACMLDIEAPAVVREVERLVLDVHADAPLP